MKTSPKQIGFYAGTLSIAEIGLGSLLHSFKVPLAGTFLSLNQLFILCRIVKLNRAHEDVRLLGFRVSVITSLLKSLSPSGKKLTPMLAIATQGGLFSIGTWLLGPNLFGMIFGGVLLSLWGFLQPFFILVLMHGQNFEKLWQYYEKVFGSFVNTQWIVYGVGWLIFIKCLLAAALAFIAWKQSSSGELRTLFSRSAFPSSRTQSRNLLEITSTNQETLSQINMGALKELCRPVILTSLVFTGVCFGFVEHEWAPVFWAVFRPMAIAYLFFFILRCLPIDKIISKYRLENSAFSYAVKMLQHDHTMERHP